jgi:hypothetical protein
MDARLESRYLSSNYTTRNLFEDLIKLNTCLMILIFSSYVKSSHKVIDLLISGQQDGRNLILFYIETYGFFLHSLFPGGIKAIRVWCITILHVLTILK